MMSSLGGSATSPPRVRSTMTVAFCASTPLRPRPNPLPSPLRSSTCPHRARMTSATDLVIVGAGTLGLRVAHLWRSSHATSSIVCATRTAARHSDLAAAGFTPSLADELSSPAANVVFCAPPGNLDARAYAAAVARAGALATGRFVFTSSTAVFADAGRVDEGSPTTDKARGRRLLEAEEEAVGCGVGVVLRLGGLYTLERGPHAVWLKRGEVAGGGEGVLNMVHYDDVARAVVKALMADAGKVVGKRLLVADGSPMTRRELLEAARVHPAYQGFHMPTFGEGGAQKRVDGSWSQQLLGWEPRHKSFLEFMKKEAELVSGTFP